MKTILIIGCGDIALRAARLLRVRYRLFGLVRNSARHAELRNAGIIPVPGDLDKRHLLDRIAGLAHTVLHFAPPHNAGGSDVRTRNLLAALSRGTMPERFIYISTSGVYGDCGGAKICETHPAHPQSERALRRLDAEQRIRDWAKRNGVRAGILRVPGIYAADRLPLERLRADTPAIVAEQDGYTNLIHADDLARVVEAALRSGKPNRVYHACDDNEFKTGDYFDAVADACHFPRAPRLPRAEVRRMVSPMQWSFMNESRRMSNARMKKELKVCLRYPTLAEALRPIRQY